MLDQFLNQIHRSVYGNIELLFSSKTGPNFVYLPFVRIYIEEEEE